MASLLTYQAVRVFVAALFPDPEPYLKCVRIHRAVAGIVVSAALLNCTSVSELSRFTGIPVELVRAVVTNLQNSHFWTDEKHPCHEWLSAAHHVDMQLLEEHVEIAFGDACTSDAQEEPIHVYNMFAETKDPFLLF